MAAAAETIKYTFVDDIPELAEARQEVRQDAWALLDERKQHEANGSLEPLPLQIDALSTAQAVLEAPKDSQDYKERLNGLRLDCQRLVAEWYRKQTWEYFPKSRHYFNAETGEFFSHGLSIRQMTENALTPHVTDKEEEGRRINERVEDETPLLVQRLGKFALDKVGIRTISECTDQALSDYEHDIKTGAKHRGYRGYVPEINKLMIRNITIDPETGDRLEEQIGLPGVYLDHDTIKKALEEYGLDVKHVDKTQLHGAQILAEDDPIEFIEHLDNVAGREWCVNIFMGEKVSENFVKNYSGVRSEAGRRQQELAKHTDMVADFVLELAKDNTDPRKAPAIVEEFVKKMLLVLAKDSHSLASQIFDTKTANGLAEVAYFESIGQAQLALERLREVEQSAPGGGFCGAGSCGLESLESQRDLQAAKNLGFDTKNTIKDTERACKCGAKTVFYDLKIAKKGCSTCGKTKGY